MQSSQSFTQIVNMENSANSNTPQEKLRKMSFDQPDTPFFPSNQNFFNHQWGIKGWSNRVQEKTFNPSQKVKTQKNVQTRKYSYKVSEKQIDRKIYIEKLQQKLLLLKQLKVKGEVQKKIQVKEQIIQKLPQIGLGLNLQKHEKNTIANMNNKLKTPQNYNFTARKTSNANSFKPLQFYTTFLRKNSSDFSQISRHHRSLSNAKDKISFISYPMMELNNKPKGLKKMIKLQDYLKYQTKKTTSMLKQKQFKNQENKKFWSDF